MEIQMAFELGNPEGWGAQAVLEIQVDGWSKNRAFHHGGVDFFWNNPFNNISKEYLTLRVPIAGPG